MRQRAYTKQELKQAAQQWAEYLYIEFQREKQLRQAANGKRIVKPTYHDQLNP